MNLDLPQIWALHEPHVVALFQVRDALLRGTHLSGPDVELLFGITDRGVSQRGRISVIPVFGLLTSRPLLNMRVGTLSRFEAQLREAATRPDISQIVLEFDSPGGETSGIEEAAALVRATRKKKRLVASVNTLSSSAAYWLASQCHEISCTPSGYVGGLGVVSHHTDASGALMRMGIKPTVVASPEGKRDASGLTPLSAGGRESIQALVNDRYAAMIRDVATGRKLSRRLVEESFGAGRLLTARQGLRVRAVDRVESLTETLDRLGGVRRESTKPTPLAERVMVGMELDMLQRKGDRLDALIERWDKDHDPLRVMADLNELEMR